MTHLMIVGRMPRAVVSQGAVMSQLQKLLDSGFALEVVTDNFPLDPQSEISTRLQAQIHLVEPCAYGGRWARLAWWFKVTAYTARRSLGRGAVLVVSMGEAPLAVRYTLEALGLGKIRTYAAGVVDDAAENGLRVELIEQQCAVESLPTMKWKARRRAPQSVGAPQSIARKIRGIVTPIAKSTFVRETILVHDRISTRLWPSQTLSGKIRHKMLMDNRLFIKDTTDKVLVRRYVQHVAGVEYLTPLLAHFEDLKEFNPDCYGPAFVIKPTHGSGAAIIVNPSSEPSPLSFPVSMNRWQTGIVSCNHDQLRSPEISALISNWINNDYWRSRARYDPSYRGLKRAVMVEPLLEDLNGDLPIDYKFFVMHGKVVWLQVHANRLHGRTVTFHWPSWERIPVHHGVAQPLRAIEKPARLSEMIALAEKLGSHTDMVRIDLYDTTDGVRFGEMTHFPNAGKFRLYPRDYGRLLAQDWSLPKEYVDPDYGAEKAE